MHVAWRMCMWFGDGGWAVFRFLVDGAGIVLLKDRAFFVASHVCVLGVQLQMVFVTNSWIVRGLPTLNRWGGIVSFSRVEKRAAKGKKVTGSCLKSFSCWKGCVGDLHCARGIGHAWWGRFLFLFSSAILRFPLKKKKKKERERSNRSQRVGIPKESTLWEYEGGVFMECGFTHQRDVAHSEWKWGARWDAKVSAVTFRDKTYHQAYRIGVIVAQGAGKHVAGRRVEKKLRELVCV